MQINRRFFLHKGTLAIAGTAAIPSFLVRSVMAEAAANPGRRLVVVFQRGAADGLNIVVPYREKNYYAMRPSIAIPQNQVLDLDGFFGLHPSLAAFKPLYDQGHLAIVHAAGSPDTTRSHFDAQDYMESGTPGVKSTEDGWLNRALQAEDLRHRCAGTCEAAHRLSRPGPGRRSAAHAGRQNSRHRHQQREQVHRRRRADRTDSPAANAFEAMYAGSGDRIFHAAGDETFEAVKMLRAANPAQYSPAPARIIPATKFGNNMKQIAQLLKANLGVEAAFTDVSGWDTHQNQGSVNGQLANRLQRFLREHRRLLARHGRRCGQRHAGHDVGVRPHRARKRHRRHRPRPRQRHVRAGRRRERRQGLRPLARPGQRPAQRRPRPGR